jgi:16S rRNA processing protein RimM
LNKDDTIRVGKITGAHGISGEIKVLPYGPPEDVAGLAGSKWTKLFINGNPYPIKGARKHKGVILFKLIGISEKEEAEALRGFEVYVSKEELPALPEGEYYWFELMGMEVRAQDGKALGRIFNIFATGSNDVYEVRGPMGEILIPAIDGVIIRVDPEKNTMTVRIPEGLLPDEASDR